MALNHAKYDFFNFLKAYDKLRSISRVLSVKLSKSLYENSYHMQSRFMNDIQNLHIFLTFPSLYTQLCRHFTRSFANGSFHDCIIAFHLK